MKPDIKIILKTAGIIILFVLLAALIIPVIFKDQIKDKVVDLANEEINAELSIGDFGITLFRNFPNLTLRLKEVNINGKDEFQGDTLITVKSFNLVFDLGSVIFSEAYRIKSVEVERPVARLIVLENGNSNYDIIPASGEEQVVETGVPEPSADESDDGETKKEMSFDLDKFKLENAVISYTDHPSQMSVQINNLDLLLSGNMAASQSSLLLETDIAAVDLILDDVKMLSQASMHGSFDIEADMENKRFTLADNSILINALRLVFSGSVAMDGEDIITDLQVSTGDTQFKSVLSMIPAIYMHDFEDLQAGGSFSIGGTVKGRYSEADTLLPDIVLSLDVNGATIIYPDLPEHIDNINIAAVIDIDGKRPDSSLVNIKQFHFEVAGNPFDMDMLLSTPASDPGLDANLNGMIDLEAFASAIPHDMNDIKGTMDMEMSLRGRMSMAENEKYEDMDVSGRLALAGFEINMDGMPPLGISVAEFIFSARYAEMQQFRADVAGNIIKLSGSLQNYLPFVLKGETLSGTLDMHSEYIDLDTIFSYLPSDSARMMTEDDTMAMAVIRLPDDINIEFSSSVDKLKYYPLEASDAEGNIILREGVLIISETGLRTLGGDMLVNAEYDSRDTLNPRLASTLSAGDIGIRESFNTFNTVQKLAPIAGGMDGDVSVDFVFSALIGEDMLPLTGTINGSGRLISEEIQLISSPVYEKLSTVLQLGEDFSNTFKDIDVSFEVRDGRVYIKPFETRLGAMKLKISGNHGFDQTIDYNLRAEVPSSSLPPGMSALLTTMAANAAMLGIEYYQPESIKMNIAIGGTVKDPQIRPSLATGEGNITAGEAIEEQAAKIIGEKTEEVKDRIGEEADRQAEEILAEAQEKADMIKEEAAEAAKRIRGEAEKNAKKLIEEAEDKGPLAKMAAERTAEALRVEADKKAARLEEEAARQADRIMAEARKKNR